jgi:hypothetical protein
MIRIAHRAASFWRAALGAIIALVLAVTLSACGGSGGSSAPPPSEGQATIGAAGGTVIGPDGVTLVVPQGALPADTTLRIARDSTAAPPLPSDIPALSEIYSFTPHGIAFGDVARVRIPFDASRLAPGSHPVFMYAQPGGRWTMLVNDVAEDSNSLTAPLMGFSWGYAGSLNPPPGSTVAPMSLVLTTPQPESLPFASPTNSFRLLEQAQTIRIHAQLAPYMTQPPVRGRPSCASTPTLPVPRLELVRVIGPWPMHTPYVDPGRGITLPGAPVVGSASGTSADFDVPMDHTHNGTAYFLVRLYCTRWYHDGTVDRSTETNPLQFGFVVLRVNIPTPVGAPTITQQPQSVTVAAGAAATFSLTASAPDSLVVRWQRSDDNGATWTTVASGVNMTSFTYTPVQAADNGARFRANVCNQLGMQLNCITSDTVILSVTSSTAAPTFTQQPQSISVQSGQTASFTAVASGTPAPSIQWYRVGSPNQAVGSPCAPGTGNSTSCTYTTAPLSLSDSGAQFFARASNSAGSVDSNTVTLTVTGSATAPTITTQPADQTVTVGANATFTVAASGTAPLSYQWYRNGTAIPGANAASYTLTNVQLADDGAEFYVEVSNSEGSVTSNTVSLTVTDAATAPTITTQPADQTVTVGADATFTVAASGTAPLSYQWYRNGTAIPGANGASYTLTNAQLADSGAQFYVEVSNSEGSVISDTVTLTVSPAPSGACGVPQLIESGSGSAYEPRVLLDSSGNATAVWIQDRGDGSFGSNKVFANRYTAGSGWGTEQIIDPTLSNAGYAVIGQDGDGNLLAVWQGGGSVYANRYTAGAGWGDSVDWVHGTNSNPSSAPALAMAASGTGVAVWISSDGTTDRIYARQYTGSEWGPAQVISDGFHRIASPDVAIGPDVAINDANGHAMAVWPQSTGSTYRPYYNVFNGTAWGTAQPIASSSANVVRIRVAMNANGQAVAIWVQNDGGAYGVYAAIYTPGSGWSAPTTLDPGTSDRTEPFVTLDNSGNAIAVWKQWDGTRHRIYARRYAQGGWSPITQLAEPGLGDAWEPSIAMDPSGNAVVTWMQWIGAGFGIFGNRYTPGNGWAGPVLLAEATNDVATPRVALNASGTAMVVWREGEGSATHPSIKALRWCP